MTLNLGNLLWSFWIGIVIFSIIIPNIDVWVSQIDAVTWIQTKIQKGTFLSIKNELFWVVFN